MDGEGGLYLPLGPEVVVAHVRIVPEKCRGKAAHPINGALGPQKFQGEAFTEEERFEITPEGCH